MSDDIAAKIEARGDDLLAQGLFGRALAQYDTLAALTGDAKKATHLAGLFPGALFSGPRDSAVWGCKNCGLPNRGEDNGFCPSLDDACWHEWSAKQRELRASS